ncbi:DUF6153 family protein [Arthrobacter sp. NPDC057013]|uniref:DUF6153 family protein n=1 Tax=Arthrobacter sp. NPDC057013 TaxID=3345999 RepID=UPI00362D4862
MPAYRSNAATFLRSAGLFSLVLAIIAGIFGMHVMNGHHLTHGPTVAMAAAESHGHPHPADEATHGMSPDAVPAATGHAVSAAAGCPDGDCIGTQSMTFSCIPAGKTGTLAVPAPGTSILAALVGAGPAGPARRGYAYLPGTPSPCQLSISRT